MFACVSRARIDNVLADNAIKLKLEKIVRMTVHNTSRGTGKELTEC